MGHHGLPPWWLEYWNSGKHGEGACGIALERGERVIVEDVERDPIFVGTPALDVQLSAGVRAVQSTPLMSRSGKPLGMFSTHYRSPRRPDEGALRLLDLLARQAADIIDHRQAAQALREGDRRKDEFLGDAWPRVAQSLSRRSATACYMLRLDRASTARRRRQVHAMMGRQIDHPVQAGR